MFLNNSEANPIEKRTAFSIIIILCLLCTYFASTSDVLRPAMPAWVALCSISVFIASIQTAYLLYYQSKIASDSPMALLACGYMAISLLAFGRMIFLPDVFSNTLTWESGSQTSTWIWMIWHAIFPLVIILYSLQTAGKLTLSHNYYRWAFILSPFVVILLASLIFYNIDVLPTISLGYQSYPLEFDLALSFLAVLALVPWKGNFSRVDLWLFLAIVAHTLDIIYVIMGEERYSTGWYLGLMNSVLASCVILGVFIQHIISMANEAALANQDLNILAETDALSGLANRRKFDSILKTLWTLAFQQKGTVCLIIVDIDHFKLYNDKFGHPAGDKCLSDVASAIKKVARREMDLVARIGGEEFAIILYGVKAKKAHDIAEEARSAVETLRIPSPLDEKKPVTISVGYALTTPDAQDNSHSLFEKADQALYAAKHGGRNRVVSSDILDNLIAKGELAPA
ncbi:MAG: GGDEF domain-containing protein [Alphaproteobacteria bacterium]|jgi:diguanylate cyclase (GGDEF)-like protein|nr:GGDEF domain-containing protein [Alphaproteobacteria bacterium]